MAKTHNFTRNSDGQIVYVVLSEIETFHHDAYSECTTLHLRSGAKLGVSETVEQVADAIDRG